MKPSIELKILDERLADAPEYATPGACAADLRAMRLAGEPILKPLMLAPGEVKMVGTGVAVHLESVSDCDAEAGLLYAGLLMPRSGLASKLRIRLANAVGLVDADYTGEVIAAIENASAQEFWITPEMRIAQLVLVPVLQPVFEVVAEFSRQTERGAGGFGSTGVA